MKTKGRRALCSVSTPAARGLRPPQSDATRAGKGVRDESAGATPGARPARRQIINTLGAYCSCCGETIRAALTIDHVRNDGAQERRTYPDLRQLYRAIIAEGIPADRYQVLCRNCHESKNARGEGAHVAEARAILGLGRAASSLTT